MADLTSQGLESPPLLKTESSAPDSGGGRHLNRKYSWSHPEIPGAPTQFRVVAESEAVALFLSPSHLAGYRAGPLPSPAAQSKPLPRPGSCPLMSPASLSSMQAPFLPWCTPRPPGLATPQLGPAHTHVPLLLYTLSFPSISGSAPVLSLSASSS